MCVCVCLPLITEYIYNCRPYVDVAYYSYGFGPVDQQLRALVVWIPLQIAALAVYPVFKVRALILFFFPNSFSICRYPSMQLWEALHPRLHTCIDILFIVVLILYNMAGNVVVVLAIVSFNLPPVPALVLSVEQVGLPAHAGFVLHLLHVCICS